MARYSIAALLLTFTVSATAGAQEMSGEAPKTSDETPAKTEEASADEFAKRVQQFYAKTKDYQASFTQTYHDLAAGSEKVSTGRVYFKKPGKMRWDYRKAKGAGMDKLYVSDGSSFWVYEYDFKQVFKQCLKDSQLPTSLNFLMGTGDLLEEFDVEFAEKSTEKTPKLRLVPKEPTSKYTELRFTLDPSTYEVVRTEIYDPYGNKNEIEFAKVRVNKNLPDSGFDFKVPKGARVLNPQQKCR